MLDQNPTTNVNITYNTKQQSNQSAMFYNIQGWIKVLL